MNILRIPAGIYAANCYIVYDEVSKEGIIVDPGGDVDDLLQSIEKANIELKYIVLTHGHGDHIGGVKEFMDRFHLPLLIHLEDSDMIKDGNINLSSIMATGPIELTPSFTLKDGDIIEFGNLNAEVIHTPGHTKGGICLKIEDQLITGDTLFKGSIGRTDLLGGDYDTLINSIRQKLLTLPDDMVVLPGHGQPSTIYNERRSNPFLI